MSAVQFPTIGRIVHVVLAQGQHRSATVVNADANDTACNLVIDLDPFSPDDMNQRTHVNTNVIPRTHYNFHCSGAHPGQLIAQSVVYDEETKAIGTWHFPERLA